ncbi:MAG: glycosyltransferase family 4 protein [Armatimonadetes bacterium]|nr:glycosyltransferase family 4 protein [Armatimonadota bacterium]
MKIAFLGPAYPLRGGIAQFIALLADEFTKNNHEVKIFSFKKQYPKLFFPGKNQIEENDKAPDFDIQPVLTPYNPFTWIPTANKIKQWQPDILILKYWIPFFAPAFGFVLQLLKSSEIKKIYLIDNIEFHEKWLFAKTLTKFAFSKADRLITLSKAVYKNAKEIFPQKQVVSGFHPTYNCYDQNRFDKKSAKYKLGLNEKKVILFFGFIKPYKGLDILLYAFPKILEKIPNAHLLIIGETYGSSEKYYKIIKDLKLSGNTKFIEKFMQTDEVEIFFKAADVLALPYKQATQSGIAQIGFDMMLGAVATPVGGLPEIVVDKKTGIVAKSCSADDFAQAVVDFFKLDEKKIRKEILEENKKYSWKSFAEIILK